MKLLPAILLLASLSTFAAEDHTQYVNPFIGTQTDATGALSGSTYPGATVPQGMVQLSPETELYVTWDPCSGYDFNKDSIFGFTHTHLSGTGCTDLIDISLLPLSETLTSEQLLEGGFSQTYSHDDEEARPGYYRVRLQPSAVNCELTATTHVGIHRYTWPADAPRTIVFDLDRSTWRGEAYYTTRAYNIIQSQLHFVDDHTIEGYRIITGWAKLRHVYFRAEFSQPIVSHLTEGDGRPAAGTDFVNGRYLRSALTFAPSAQPLTVKVAISPIDGDGARANMLAEAAGISFDECASRAHDLWQQALSTIDIEADDEQRTIFYTALYHALLQPGVMSDVDGRYRNPRHEICRMPAGHAYYSTFSLWDTFRAAHPLYLLLYPDIAADFVRSMLLHHEAYGYLPIWDLWGQDNYCMIGNHSIPVISDAILAGLPGIDVEACYKAMVESSTRIHLNSPFDLWEKYGYMPADLQRNSVSITLEQAFDDACVAAVAEALGHNDDAERFRTRSLYYRNLWDPSTRFFRARNSDGQFVTPFDPYTYEDPSFIEGNAWQYMWFVPQDVEGLTALLGGRDALIAKLDSTFTITTENRDANGNASGFVGQYAHGNEPSHHTTYLYALSGKPRRTCELVDHVRRTFYNATPCGYAGNDDCGQMSSWYIFSALGFYPVHAGAAQYVIGTPLYPHATLHLAEGKDLVIEAPKVSPQALYPRTVTLNGTKLPTPHTLSHTQLTQGGTLHFNMTR